jgi:predicted phosphoribosyltransferase
MSRFRDRFDAGRRLARELTAYSDDPEVMPGCDVADRVR